MDLMEVGKLVGPVTVGYVEKPDTVWISLDSSTELIMERMDEVQSFEKMDKISVGNICAAIFSEDGAYYRVKVLNVNDDNSADVRFCDFGNVDKKLLSELYKLPSGLQVHPELAFPVKVYGVNNVTNSSKNRARVERKLSIEELMVKLECLGKDITGQFYVDNNIIMFSKSKDNQAQRDIKLEAYKNSEERGQSLQNVVINESSKLDQLNDVKVKDNVRPFDCLLVSDLPRLELLEGEEIGGSVVYVSPEGVVWFSPEWIQAPLHRMSLNINQLKLNNELQSLPSESFRNGLLCVACSLEDDCLYRSEIISFSSDCVYVQYIDFGNCENLPRANTYKYPGVLEMLEPAATEVHVADDLPLGSTRITIENQNCLPEVEQLVLVLEPSKTKRMIGRFYSRGLLVTWETCALKKSDNKSNFYNAVLDNASPVISVPEVPSRSESKNKTTDEIIKSKGDISSKPKLIRYVPAIPVPQGVDASVYMVHMESIKKIWVSRTEDEGRITLIMDKLAFIRDKLHSAVRLKKGAVYGAVYQEDGELYRIVVTNIVEDKINVRFIDFGNVATISGIEAFDIPEDIGKEAAGAFLVELDHNLEDSAENFKWVEDFMRSDTMAVSLQEHGYVVKNNGIKISFDEYSNCEDDIVVESVIEKDETSDKVKEKIVKQCFNSVEVNNNLSETQEPVCLPSTPSLDLECAELGKSLIIQSNVDRRKEKLTACTDISSTRSFMKAVTEVQCQDTNQSLVSSGDFGCCTVLELEREHGVRTSEACPEFSHEVISKNVSLDLPVDSYNNLKCSPNGGNGDEGNSFESIPNHQKVSDWIGKNEARIKESVLKKKNFTENTLMKKTLPPDYELGDYSASHSGSVHLQSLLNSENTELCENVLSALLKHPQGLFSLMINKNSSGVIQKLIEILPSSCVIPMKSVILANFVKLSLDCHGCHVVQSLLNHCQFDEREVCSVLTKANTALVLATDVYGTFVAQACLPHMADNLESLCTLTISIHGHISVIGKTQSGSFFLQRLATILSTHYINSDVAFVLLEEILINLPQLIEVEWGSRLIQSMIQSGCLRTLIRVSRWIEDNVKLVIGREPAIHVILTVLECLYAKMKDGEIWPAVLSRMIKSFLKIDNDSARTHCQLTSAALDENGHRIVKKIVANINVSEENTKNDVMKALAYDVDVLSVDRYGVEVLRALSSVM